VSYDPPAHLHRIFKQASWCPLSRRSMLYAVQLCHQTLNRLAARTTPALLGLFSWITLAADHLQP